MKFVVRPHKWYRLHRIPWDICWGCGLVALNNPISHWCVKMGCDHDEHPEYRNKLRVLTRMPGNGR